MSDGRDHTPFATRARRALCRVACDALSRGAEVGHDRGMRSKSFFPGGLFFAVAFAAFAFVACNGNVIVDNGPCPSGEKACDGVCVDTATDYSNCGACGVVCNGKTACINGACGGVTSNPSGTGGGSAGSNPTGGSSVGGATPGCPPGYSLCGDLCTDLYSDPYNCGACGNYCGQNGYCDGGGCVIPPDCVTCGEFISGSGANLCPGPSEDLYNTLVNCVCAGSCIAQCQDNACAGSDITPECQDCVVDTVNGCGNEFNECANDI